MPCIVKQKAVIILSNYKIELRKKLVYIQTKQIKGMYNIKNYKILKKEIKDIRK